MRVRAETRARALALQLLYGWDVAGDDDPRPLWQRMLGLARAGPRVTDQALALAEAVVAGRAALDARIRAAAARWRLERLGVIDRNVLRLGVHELAGATVPPKVAIDEAVRLARWFGGPRSPGFVNGVLDRVARDLGRL